MLDMSRVSTCARAPDIFRSLILTIAEVYCLLVIIFYVIRFSFCLDRWIYYYEIS
jgi:hypothetical protein